MGSKTQNNHSEGAPKVAGLFAGIGGIELGLKRAGFSSALLCEIDDAAQRVLRAQFPEAVLKSDIRELRELPAEIELLAGGFPCQDLSQAGRTAGISGKNSGLVGHVFRLLESHGCRLKWLLLENVSFMLQLDRGHAMKYLTRKLESLGFTWAYRVVDSRAFGLPQRRQRVILVASRSEDPRRVLFSDEAGQPVEVEAETTGFGFYWTEGTRGLGWAVDAVPTLKGGSTVGIPSPPAIWFPSSGKVVVPDIRDAERLQGFPVDWTLPSLQGEKVRKGARWKLVGNAVSVPVAEWVGERLMSPGPPCVPTEEKTLKNGSRWPRAAWGKDNVAYQVDISMWPRQLPRETLKDFLRFETYPLSVRATEGFLARARASSLRFHDGFLAGLDAHLMTMKHQTTVSATQSVRVGGASVTIAQEESRKVAREQPSQMSGTGSIQKEIA